MQLSPDGMYYWDGRSWVSTLSPDGRHRWNGTAWIPTGGTPLPGFAPRVAREPTAWTRPLQLAVAAWFALGAIVALTAPLWITGMMSSVMNQSIQQQQQLNPEASPLPAGVIDAMMTTVTWIVWITAAFVFVLYAVGFAGAVMRWTWLYYVLLAWLGLGLLSLPVNVADAVSGRMVTGATSVSLPPTLTYLGLVFALIQAGLFVWMLFAMVRFGPWAMRRVTT